MTRTTHVLFLCTGNTCRSPLAAGLLARVLAERRMDGVTVGSAGTDALEGAPVSEGSYLVGLERGIDLSGHRATPLTGPLIAGATLVLGMTSRHVDRARALDPGIPAHLLSAFAGAPAVDVPDPFGGDITSYRDMLDHLEPLVTGVADRLAADAAGDEERRTR
jgi:protein-tyrosine phosphatase